MGKESVAYFEVENSWKVLNDVKMFSDFFLSNTRCSKKGNMFPNRGACDSVVG
jgi:hypothetical protein